MYAQSQFFLLVLTIILSLETFDEDGDKVAEAELVHVVDFEQVIQEEVDVSAFLSQRFVEIPLFVQAQVQNLRVSQTVGDVCALNLCSVETLQQACVLEDIPSGLC